MLCVILRSCWLCLFSTGEVVGFALLVAGFSTGEVVGFALLVAGFSTGEVVGFALLVSGFATGVVHLGSECVTLLTGIGGIRPRPINPKPSYRSRKHNLGRNTSHQREEKSRRLEEDKRRVKKDDSSRRWTIWRSGMRQGDYWVVVDGLVMHVWWFNGGMLVTVIV
ncbi:hypothetical protein Patl1_34886 [Pistacia atlantica]|uniref:Uncharacterized protein n=1 Tax=Pistacia atlantica TaxID=434234 RepID=A0ACC0ZSJ8_9ROSI|nr:hypothetical protein Patl1_34886 [Pistacia atlantica]